MSHFSQLSPLSHLNLKQWNNQAYADAQASNSPIAVSPTHERGLVFCLEPIPPVVPRPQNEPGISFRISGLHCEGSFPRPGPGRRTTDARIRERPSTPLGLESVLGGSAPEESTAPRRVSGLRHAQAAKLGRAARYRLDRRGNFSPELYVACREMERKARRASRQASRLGLRNSHPHSRLTAVTKGKSDKRSEEISGCH